MAIKAAVTPAEAVAYLNELLACDRQAIHRLVEDRVPASEALVDHPTCQVVLSASEGESPSVGLLGVLNGLFGLDDMGWGAISAIFDEDRVVGFRLGATSAAQKQPTKEEP